jgi:trehalose 6-phosphate phosphatase
LFLDVDGTLLELAHRPDAVRLNVNLLQVLPKLHKRLGGALALVSGRMIADLDTLFMPLHLPAAGLHGMERRDASGLLHSAGSVHLLEDIRGPLRRFAETHDGILLEDKGAALALHFRQAPELEAEAHGFVRDLVAHREDLHYLAGKMVFEIKSHKIDKGNARLLP